jgi:hypothetical protein
MTDKEEYLHQMIRLLQEEHAKQLQPYYEQLAKIRAMEIKPRCYIPTEDILAARLRKLLGNTKGL